MQLIRLSLLALLLLYSWGKSYSQIRDESEVYAFLNDLPKTYFGEPLVLHPYTLEPLELHPDILNEDKLVYWLRNILQKGSAYLYYRNTFQQLNKTVDSIYQLNPEKHSRDSIYQVVQKNNYPTNFSDLLSLEEMEEMAITLSSKKIKWRKKRAKSFSFSKKKSKFRISIPAFNESKTLCVFLLNLPGSLNICIFRLTDNGWEGYSQSSLIIRD